MDAQTCRVSDMENGRVGTTLRLPQARELILNISLIALYLAAALAGSGAGAVPLGALPAAGASPGPAGVAAPVPLVPRFRIRLLRGRLAVETAADPAQAVQRNTDQVSVRAFNVNANAINIIAGSFTPVTNTPHNADQVFAAVFNPSSNAIQVNCVSGCGTGTVNSGTSGRMAYYPATGTAVSGSANATISNGTLTLGANGTAAGVLALANSATGGAAVTLQNLGASTAYNFNLPATAGTSGQCLQSGGGGAPDTWGACGSAANPGGSSGQIQYNSSSAFGGFTLAGDCTLSIPNITCNRTNGTAFAPSATTDATNASNISSGTLAAARLPSGVAQTNQSNAYSTGTQDFSGATSLKVPVKAGATATANGQIAYDSTANVPHMAVASADAKLATFTATPATGNCVKWINGTQVGDQGAACGSVTSVGLALPGIFAVSGSPVTGGGTLTGTLSSQTANTFFAGPSGSAGTPAFRAIVAADIPTLNQNTTGNATTATALAGTPTLCLAGQAPTGISANGNAAGCAPFGTVTGSNLTSGQLLAGSGGAGVQVANLTGDITTSGGLGTTVSAIKGSSVPALASGYLHYTGSTFSWDTPSSMVYPAGGIPLSTGVAWGTSLLETDNNMIVGVSGAWAEVSTLPTPLFPSLSGDVTNTAGSLSTTVGKIKNVAVPALAAGYLHYNGSAFVWDTPTGGGTPGGTDTAVQYNSSGTSFAGDASNFAYNPTTHAVTLTGTVTASSFVSTGTAPGTITWTSGSMSAGTAGTVQCGANTGSVFACSLNGSAVFSVPFIVTGSDLGGTPLMPQVAGVHASYPVNLNNQPLTVQRVNDGTSGTVINETVKLASTGTGNTTTAVVTAGSETAGVLGICQANCGTSAAPPAMIATSGQALLLFDATAIGAANDYVQQSATAGLGHDAGSSKPSSGQILGQTLGPLPSSAPNQPATGTIAGTDTGTTKCAGATCYVKFTYVNLYGETVASAEKSQAVTSGNLLTATSPGASTGATSYNVFVSTSSGGEVYQQTLAIGTNYTESTGGLNTTTADQFGYVSPPPNNLMAVSLVNRDTNSGGGSMVYPGAGIAISTGSAWGASLTETDGDMVAGVAGSWSKVSTLPTAMMPALTGDVTNTAGALATTVGGIKGASVPALASGYLHYTGSAFAWDTPGSMVYPGAGISNSTGSAWGTSYGAQGTDTNLLTAGTVSGTGSTLCTDANGGATTSGCSSGGAAPIYVWTIPNNGGNMNTGQATTANVYNYIPISGYPPGGMSPTKMQISIQTADGTNNSSFGIATGTSGGTCTVQVKSTAATYGSAGITMLTVSGTIPAPSSSNTRMFFVWTSAAGTIKPGYMSNSMFATSGIGPTGTTSGGALGTSFSCPTDLATAQTVNPAAGMLVQ